ncbi:MAG: protein kinase, partial [Chloroflexi bacterium]|nr:protein kinase [Chloroflexota bacterium]
MAAEQIGKYRVIEEIASGGQGAVFRAFDPSTGMIVAIKVLHAQFANNEAFVERFRREARLIQAITHQNVVKIFDVGESEGSYFIVLEFIPESLSNLIEATGALPADRAVALAIGISEGIGQAHAQGIIHRDIKPQNVLLTPEGIPKVTDFGIARDVALETMTMTGVMMGTPYYMSPEQAEGKRADKRSDVYSLGCLLYRLLSGDVPFSGDTPLVILRRHVDETPQPLQKMDISVPGAVVKCVERAMAKNPSRRYADANEFALALRRAMPSLMIDTPVPAPVAPVTPAPPPPEPSVPEPAVSTGGTTPVKPDEPPVSRPTPVSTGRQPEARSRGPSAASGVARLVSGLFASVRTTLAVLGAVAVIAVVVVVGLNSGGGSAGGPDVVERPADSPADVGGFVPEIGAAGIVASDDAAPGGASEPDPELPASLVATAAAEVELPAPTATSFPSTAPVPVSDTVTSDSGWVRVGGMLSANSTPSATLLADGRVLVLGIGRTAEIYNPSTRSFSLTGAPSCEYDDVNSVLLADGRVLVTGGGGDFRCAEVFDPATETFSNTVGMVVGHLAHTATLLQDGRVLITGGWDSSGRTTDLVEIYDPETGRFTRTSRLAIFRGDHFAALLPSGEVLIAGGIMQSTPKGSESVREADCLSTAEIFDPTTGMSRVVNRMPVGSCEPRAAVLPNGEILISTGHDRAVIFLPDSETFRSISPMNSTHDRHAMTSLADGRVMVVGGWDWRVGSQNALDTVEIYDHSTGEFQLIDSLSQERQEHAAVLLQDGTVLVIGGVKADVLPNGEKFYSALNSVELFDPATSLSPPGLVHLWSGDGNATDSAGDNDGVAFGGVTYTDGVFAQAFNFDGTGSITLAVDVYQPFVTGADSTLGAWIFPTSPISAETHLTTYREDYGIIYLPEIKMLRAHIQH